MIYLRLCLIAALALVTACATQETKPTSVALPAGVQVFTQENTNTVIQPYWSTDVGKRTGEYAADLTPVVDGKAFYLPAENGRIKAVDHAGKLLWDIKLDAKIMAGMAVDVYRLYCVTNNAALTAIDKTTGEVEWETPLTNLVLAPPVSNNLILAVHGVDGDVSGYDPHSGKRLWIYQNKAKTLTKRGNARPVFFGDEWLIQGMDNGKLVGIAPQQGSLAWSVNVSEAQYGAQANKIIDIDEPVQLFANYALAASYKGDLVILNLNNGKIESRLFIKEGVRKYIGQPEYMAIGDGEGKLHLLYHRANAQPKLFYEFAGTTITQLHSSGKLLFVSNDIGELLVIDLQKEAVVDRKPLNQQVLAVNGELLLTANPAGEYSLLKYSANNN